MPDPATISGPKIITIFGGQVYKDQSINGPVIFLSVGQTSKSDKSAILKPVGIGSTRNPVSSPPAPDRGPSPSR
jgi:hypothetical protein